MGWIAAAPASFVGRAVGTGQCVAYVCEACRAPPTMHWRRGVRVKDGGLRPGTAIATFDPAGTYGNHTDGRSHAAVLHEVMAEGLLVWDQWLGHLVAPRLIRFKSGLGAPVNDGDQFFAAEPAGS